MTTKEKAIRWFEDIAYECDKLTSGNVAHLRAQIKGMAIRSAEYLKKQEPASEDLEEAAESAVLSVFTGYADTNTPFRAEKIALVSRIFKAGAQWDREQMMKDAIDTRIDKRLADMIGYTGSERVKVIIIKE